MTSLGLYCSPDSTMDTAQNSPNTPFADSPPVRHFHSSNFRCLDICCDRQGPEGRDGGGLPAGGLG